MTVDKLSRDATTHRATHSNPIVEHVFQRVEAGENLLSIFENLTGWRWKPWQNRMPNETEPLENFMTAFVLGTIAPGSEFQRDERIARTRDLEKPNDVDHRAERD